ncbi:MAG: methyltransferase domain-containing protein [Bacteroidales bacterium]|jgi:DNA modification methylase|nr:methyltransferase domain-containing protein [Bacteroidales bacterium]
MEGKIDSRNKLNDLTGKDWLKLTKSFWLSEKCVDDKDAFKHPAPFMIKDIMKLISIFTKKGMSVLDPFCGSGTTLIAANNIQRIGLGIDLSEEYKKLAIERLSKKGFSEKVDYHYRIGDANKVLKKVKQVDYIVTSPPYHNILRNKGEGLRKQSEKGFRNGSRIGVEYYSEFENDLGNKETYKDFLLSFEQIMKKCFAVLNAGKYTSIIISDFTVDKAEVCVQADIVKSMQNCGFEFVGTIVLLQDNKPLYPFGYPYAYKINHNHQNIINFRKPKE